MNANTIATAAKAAAKTRAAAPKSPAAPKAAPAVTAPAAPVVSAPAVAAPVAAPVTTPVAAPAAKLVTRINWVMRGVNTPQQLAEWVVLNKDRKVGPLEGLSADELKAKFFITPRGLINRQMIRDLIKAEDAKEGRVRSPKSLPELPAGLLDIIQVADSPKVRKAWARFMRAI